MREEEPVARSENHGGSYIATRYEDVRAAAKDAVTFSSAQGTGIPPLPIVGMIPIDIDPPDQREYRRILNPAFNVEEVAKHENRVRTLVRELIDPFVGQESFEVAGALATQLPPRTTLGFIGLPPRGLADAHQGGRRHHAPARLGPRGGRPGRHGAHGRRRRAPRAARGRAAGRPHRPADGPASSATGRSTTRRSSGSSRSTSSARSTRRRSRSPARSTPSPTGRRRSSGSATRACPPVSSRSSSAGTAPCRASGAP